MKCEKVGYSTRNKAHHAIKLIAKRGVEMRTYNCNLCYKWHLTSDVNTEKYKI